MTRRRIVRLARGFAPFLRGYYAVQDESGRRRGQIRYISPFHALCKAWIARQRARAARREDWWGAECERDTAARRAARAQEAGR